ncbi:MAG: hypothetical protein NW206_17690 [Hyphomonadaceae bacterium]|nr:hypothetical protein [Hyphomonadaceae bacterium]
MSAHAPTLELHLSKDGDVPLFASFIGRFELQDAPSQGVEHHRTYEDPGPFRTVAPGEEGAPYHVIGVRFIGGFRGRLTEAFDEDQVIDESAFDGSSIPGSLLRNETIDQNFARRDRYLRETGLSPDPGFYEVEGSQWVAEVASERTDLHHYIILGLEEYAEVLAEGWEWELGQPVRLTELARN